jgi:hypothetical protein
MLIAVSQYSIYVVSIDAKKVKRKVDFGVVQGISIGYKSDKGAVEENLLPDFIIHVKE